MYKKLYELAIHTRLNLVSTSPRSQLKERSVSLCSSSTRRDASMQRSRLKNMRVALFCASLLSSSLPTTTVNFLVSSLTRLMMSTGLKPAKNRTCQELVVKHMSCHLVQAPRPKSSLSTAKSHSEPIACKHDEQAWLAAGLCAACCSRSLSYSHKQNARACFCVTKLTRLCLSFTLLLFKHTLCIPQKPLQIHRLLDV